ncbi:unnamed protein product [Prorocentrum cordatum]|uniref:Uncharacterized protein n=1 Tax=Prorocentrum cordatum TaxID=2364126 RepID=A0ABN9W1X8_9DINO|nr:unnamed protein product [Polarella glacialis]
MRCARFNAFDLKTVDVYWPALAGYTNPRYIYIQLARNFGHRGIERPFNRSPSSNKQRLRCCEHAALASTTLVKLTHALRQGHVLQIADLVIGFVPVFVGDITMTWRRRVPEKSTCDKTMNPPTATAEPDRVQSSCVEMTTTNCSSCVLDAAQ